MAVAMLWAKRFLKRLGFSDPQAPSPEEQPAEIIASGLRFGAAGSLCTRCRRTLVRNPHQVRAGRARARSAERDERGRFLSEPTTIAAPNRQRNGSSLGRKRHQNASNR
jgi:hypothetical protein